MDVGTITVFGGSGFIGRHLVRRLASAGARVRVATRDPEASQFLRPMGDVGQIAPVLANIRDQRSVEAAITGADAVVNLVGLLYERGRQTFSEVHANGAARVAAAAKAAGATRLVHVSAIGADRLSPSAYARSKAEGEAGARAAFAQATIVRPSVVFGPEDDFFNRFAALARVSPALPLIGGGETRFQPVYVRRCRRRHRPLPQRSGERGAHLRAGRPTRLHVPRDNGVDPHGYRTASPTCADPFWPGAHPGGVG